MSPRILLKWSAAIGAIGAAAAVVIVAASFALYALARDYLGPAGGAAVVSGVFALVAVIVAWVATRKAVPPRRGKAAPEATLPERAMQLVREKPLIALGAAAAAVVVVIRNPGLLTALVTAFAAGNATRPPPK